MMKKLLFICSCILSMATAHAQDSSAKPLTFCPRIDLPVTGAAAAWTLYGFAEIGKKDGTSLDAINNLKKSDIPWFDRWAVRPYNKSVDKISYLPFYAAIPYPVILLALNKNTRKDYAKLTFLYLEAMTITGAFYTSAVHYFSRLRPLVYSSESPLNVRQGSNARNAFFAGHVALVATSTFFMARVFADYNPDSKWKKVVYGGAIAATAFTAYMRHRAGEHFPSDIAVGTLVGTLSGLLTPSLHEVKVIRNHKLTLLPFAGRSQGISMIYKL